MLVVHKVLYLGIKTLFRKYTIVDQRCDTFRLPMTKLELYRHSVTVWWLQLEVLPNEHCYWDITYYQY